MTRRKKPFGTAVIPNMFALERDFHFTVSIDAGPTRARRSPCFHVRKLNLRCELTYPYYLVTTEVVISSAKEAVVIPQVAKVWVGDFINSPLTIVGLLAINTKDLQCMLTHSIDKLTSKLSHTMKELNTMHQLPDSCNKNKPMPTSD
jgi:hypothetical protein